MPIVERAVSPGRLGCLARCLGLCLCLGLCVCLVAAGCATSGPASVSTRAPKMPVVASIDSWGSVLSQLGGNRVQEMSIVSTPAVDARHYRPTGAEAAAIAAARVLVVNGIGYDSWVTAGASPSAGRSVVDVGQVLSIGAGGNPNQAYSRAAVHRVVDAITAALQAADPADRAYFAERRTRFETVALEPLDTLEATIRQTYAGATVGASSTAAEPLAESLGLDLVTPRSFLNTVAAGGTPTPEDLATIDDQIRNRRIRVYLDNVQHSTPAVAAQVRIAEKADVPVVTITETLSPKDATFQAWQLQQLTALRTALQENAEQQQP